MDTFKQYYTQILNEMSGETPALVVKAMQNRLRAAHDVSRKARRGRIGQDAVADAMEDMVHAHNELKNFGGDDLKRKIVDKYNELKATLQGENYKPTVEHLEDCVQFIQSVCDELLAG